jgi:hypothetical protein
MKFKTFTTALILALAFSGSAFAEKWFHVQVEGDGDEKVSVNLPVSLMRSAAALIPNEANDEMHIAIDDLDMNWADLLTFWEEVKKAPEATFVTVETGDETVKVRKEGEFVIVKTTEAGKDGTQVDVTFPMAVIDALLSGPEGTLNFEGALDALAAYGPGTLVTVRDGDQSVRVWIDDQNEAE